MGPGCAFGRGTEDPVRAPMEGPIFGLASISPQGLLPFCSTPQDPAPSNVTWYRALLGIAPGCFLACSLMSG